MTFRYKRGESVREKSIKKIASEDFFYRSSTGDNDVDQRMTSYENETLSGLIQELRDSDDLSLSDFSAEQIKEAVVHLWMRSRNLRDIFAKTSVNFLDESKSTFADPKNLKDIILGNATDKIDETIFQEAIKVVPSLARRPKTEVTKLLKELFKQNPHIFDELSKQAEGYLSAAKDLIQPTVKDAHISFLQEYEERDVRQFENYRWRIIEYHQQEIVFPDCVLLTYDTEKGFTPFILDIGEKENVILPLSTSRLLFGHKDDSVFGIDQIHLSKIGGCAFEFFIFPRNLSTLENEKERIGERYRPFVEEVSKEALREYRDLT